jgi:hypothetical protein
MGGNCPGGYYPGGYCPRPVIPVYKREIIIKFIVIPVYKREIISTSIFIKIVEKKVYTMMVNNSTNINKTNISTH